MQEYCKQLNGARNEILEDLKTGFVKLPTEIIRSVENKKSGENSSLISIVIFGWIWNVLKHFKAFYSEVERNIEHLKLNNETNYKLSNLNILLSGALESLETVICEMFSLKLKEI